MIDVAFQKKMTAIFLNSCFLAPMILMTVVITIAPVASAENVCDVPVNNNWLVSDKINQHEIGWMDGHGGEELKDPIIADFSMDINVKNDSASAISMILSSGKSYTFCFSFDGDPKSPPNNGAKGDVYLMTKGNWDLYETNYELRFDNWLNEVGFLPVEYRDTITWMPFRDVHAYEKVSEDYFTVAIDTESTSWLTDKKIEYYLVFDNWDNNHNTDEPAAGGGLNIELLVDVENRLVLPKFTAYILVAILPLSCLIVPFIINSKYHSYGLEKPDIDEKEIVPLLEG
jgi:hypothetical protein